MEDKIISELLNTKLWLLKPKRVFDDPENVYTIDSHMKGFNSGRYRLIITKMRIKRDNSLYKISIYWTPYNPFNLVFKGRFNSFDELKNIIGTVNKDLLDISRAYT